MAQPIRQLHQCMLCIKEANMEEEKKKFQLQYVFRPIIFVAIILAIIFSLNNLFATTLDTKIARITGYRAEKENSLDIVAIGNSEIYSAYAPAVMFKEYNYTSYNMGQSQQTLKQTYDWLKDMFKYQNPSLVIWEVENLYSYKDITVQKLADNFGFFVRHDNWKNIGDLTTQKGREKARRSKGFVSMSEVEGYFGGDSYMSRTDLNLTTNKEYRPYIDKIVKLCKKHNAELLMMKTAQSVWSNARYEATKRLADSYGLKYLDFNTNYDINGLDLSIHSRDGGGHLNTAGAKVTTEFLGRYINDNYSIVKKDNYDKASWDSCVKDFYG